LPGEAAGKPDDAHRRLPSHLSGTLGVLDGFTPAIPNIPALSAQAAPGHRAAVPVSVHIINPTAHDCACPLSKTWHDSAIERLLGVGERDRWSLARSQPMSSFLDLVDVNLNLNTRLYLPPPDPAMLACHIADSFHLSACSSGNPTPFPA
jgi:hypothetical protein